MELHTSNPCWEPCKARLRDEPVCKTLPWRKLQWHLGKLDHVTHIYILKHYKLAFAPARATKLFIYQCSKVQTTIFFWKKNSSVSCCMQLISVWEIMNDRLGCCLIVFFIKTSPQWLLEDNSISREANQIRWVKETSSPLLLHNE